MITGQNCLFMSLAEKILEHLLSFRPRNNNSTAFILIGSLRVDTWMRSRKHDNEREPEYWRRFDHDHGFHVWPTDPGVLENKKRRVDSRAQVWRHHRCCWELAASSRSLDTLTCTQIYTISLSHTQTNNKSQSFPSDIQIKTKRPSGGAFYWSVVCLWQLHHRAMKCRPGQGGIIVYPPTISNHSLV